VLAPPNPGNYERAMEDFGAVLKLYPSLKIAKKYFKKAHDAMVNK